MCKKSLIDDCPDTDEFKFIKENGLGKVGINKQYKVKDTFDEITVTVKHRIIDDDFVILSWEVEKKPKPKKKKTQYNAQILLDARKNAGLTQAELAQRIGADKGYISRIERGLTIPTVSTLYKIAAAMGMTVELRPM